MAVPLVVYFDGLGRPFHAAPDPGIGNSPKRFLCLARSHRKWVPKRRHRMYAGLVTLTCAECEARQNALADADGEVETDV